MNPTDQTDKKEQDYGSWAKIVIVEDDAALADIYKTRLEVLGYICFVAHQGIEALELIERERPSLVLLDIMIPKVAGDQILKVLRSSDWGKDIKVLVISNLNESDAPAGIREQGIEGYAVKANLSNDQLDKMVDRILKPSDQNEDVSLETDPSAVTSSPGVPTQAADIPVQPAPAEPTDPNQA
ncbi:MAG TPA: response regulator [Candidatus Saccharimonadales bacterium]|nr:response regulator [Candidatus Saccharimonadales bacterium]